MFWQWELTTHSLFLSITRLTRMALCSEYSLHTPVWEISKKLRLGEHNFFLVKYTHSFLATRYCRRNTTHFLSNLQWSLRQLFCAPSPEQTGRPCVLKCRRQIQHDLLTGYWIAQKSAFSVHTQELTNILYILHITIFNTATFKHRFCKQVNYYKKVKPQTNLCHTMLVIFIYAAESCYLHEVSKQEQMSSS